MLSVAYLLGCNRSSCVIGLFLPVVRYLVFPKQPIVLAGCEFVDLPGYDLWLHFVEKLMGTLTWSVFATLWEALCKCILMTHSATGGRWFIQLTNSGQPVEAEDRRDEFSTCIIQGDWVIQEDLSPLPNQLPPNAIVVNGSASLLQDNNFQG